MQIDKKMYAVVVHSTVTIRVTILTFVAVTSSTGAHNTAATAAIARSYWDTMPC